MSQRFYGIFKLVYDSWTKDGRKRAKLQLLKDANEAKPDDVFVKSHFKLAADRSSLANTLSLMRRAEAASLKYFRGPRRFKTAFFIHETDEKGYLIPTKADLNALSKQGC